MRISDWSSDVCSSDLGCFASLIYISTYIYERTIGPWNKIAPAGRGTRRCCRENLSRRRTEFPAALLSLFPAAHGARFGIGRRVCRGARLYSACCHPNAADDGSRGPDRKIGRASCRERVGQYVYISVVAGSLKKKKNK